MMRQIPGKGKGTILIMVNKKFNKKCKNGHEI